MVYLQLNVFFEDIWKGWKNIHTNILIVKIISENQSAFAVVNIKSFFTQLDEVFKNNFGKTCTSFLLANVCWQSDIWNLYKYVV